MRVLGIGLDLVDLHRVRRLLARHGQRARRKLLTEAERAHESSLTDSTAYVAARIAAKEAAYKALQSLPGARAVGWRDIEVRKLTDGRPTLAFTGCAAELTERYGPLEALLTLTHTETTAAAVVLLLAQES